MKLRFNRQEMADLLAPLCAVAAARTPKEILRCVKLEAKADVLFLCATDLEISLRCAATHVEVDEPGETVIVADTFARIMHECSDETLAVETDASELHVRGAGSHFQILTQDAAEFPAVGAMEEEPHFTVPQNALRRQVEWTSLAAARESTRYAINGVLFELEGDRLTLAATDGRRLSVAPGTVTRPDSTQEVGSVIVPTKALAVFSRLATGEDDLVSVHISSNRMLVSVAGAQIGTSLVEGHFPSYRDVVPTDCDRETTLKTAEFAAALKQAALLTNEESRGVRLAFSDGDLTITSRAPEQGEATISIPVVCKHEPMEIGFNPVFLLDVLRVVTADEVTLTMKEANRPGILRAGGEFLYVVMPVNLSSS